MITTISKISRFFPFVWVRQITHAVQKYLFFNFHVSFFGRKTFWWEISTATFCAPTLLGRCCCLVFLQTHGRWFFEFKRCFSWNRKTQQFRQMVAEQLQRAGRHFFQIHRLSEKVGKKWNQAVLVVPVVVLMRANVVRLERRQTSLGTQTRAELGLFSFQSSVSEPWMFSRHFSKDSSFFCPPSKLFFFYIFNCFCLANIYLSGPEYFWSWHLSRSWWENQDSLSDGDKFLGKLMATPCLNIRIYARILRRLRTVKFTER